VAREPVDLAALARDLVGDARALAPDRPIALDAAGATEVVGDEMRLRQVLTNLLANARVHTPPGTPVGVRVAAVGEDVALEVRDEGPGIPPEDLDRIFERFFRADPSRARASGGNGLGLSIVAAIVAAHGGRVEAESAVGRGATFRILLPRASAPTASTSAGARTPGGVDHPS
jgi:two-component system, OmpR family, sensor kinase